MDKTEYKQLEPTLIPLPCPFCGKPPRIVPSQPELDGDAWGAVMCTNKRCHVRPICKDGEDISDMRGPGAYKDAAIMRWNYRRILHKSK